jgi:hypothetical protein
MADVANEFKRSNHNPYLMHKSHFNTGTVCQFIRCNDSATCCLVMAIALNPLATAMFLPQLGHSTQNVRGSAGRLAIMPILF